MESKNEYNKSEMKVTNLVLNWATRALLMLAISSIEEKIRSTSSGDTIGFCIKEAFSSGFLNF
jgi:hypothetical protein